MKSSKVSRLIKKNEAHFFRGSLKKGSQKAPEAFKVFEEIISVQDYLRTNTANPIFLGFSRRLQRHCKNNAFDSSLQTLIYSLVNELSVENLKTNLQQDLNNFIYVLYGSEVRENVFSLLPMSTDKVWLFGSFNRYFKKIASDRQQQIRLLIIIAFFIIHEPEGLDSQPQKSINLYWFIFGRIYQLADFDKQLSLAKAQTVHKIKSSKGGANKKGSKSSFLRTFIEEFFKRCELPSNFSTQDNGLKNLFNKNKGIEMEGYGWKALTEQQPYKLEFEFYSSNPNKEPTTKTYSFSSCRRYLPKNPKKSRAT